jgi:hypothetical protein
MKHIIYFQNISLNCFIPPWSLYLTGKASIKQDKIVSNTLEVARKMKTKPLHGEVPEGNDSLALKSSKIHSEYVYISINNEA